MTKRNTVAITQVVGLDLRDRYCQIVALDFETGQVLEHSRVRTTPRALRNRFAGEATGTPDPWASYWQAADEGS